MKKMKELKKDLEQLKSSRSGEYAADIHKRFRDSDLVEKYGDSKFFNKQFRKEYKKLPASLKILNDLVAPVEMINWLKCILETKVSRRSTFALVQEYS